MAPSVERDARETKIDQLKRLIVQRSHEPTESLEDAVDALLWSDHDRLQQAQYEGSAPNYGSRE